MSQPCQHNDHGHWLLWMAIWFLWMGTMMDCSGKERRLEDRIDRLESEARSAHQVALDNSANENTLKYQIEHLQSEIEVLRSEQHNR